MSASFYDLMKYARTGIASPSMTYYDRMRASALMGGVVQTLTGIPPLPFKANGKPLISWSMSGNGQQTGTPSPDNIIMPTFCGVRAGNLAPPLTEWVDGYINSATGTINDPSATQEKTSAFIAISDATKITISYEHGNLPSTGTSTSTSAWTAVGWYDNTKTFISRTVSNAGGLSNTHTAPSGAAFVRISFRTFGETGNIMLNLGSTALPYEPYGYKIPITCAGQTTPVYLGQTQTVRKVKKYEFTGNENFNIDECLRFNIFISNIKPISGGRKGRSYCSHYECLYNSEPYDDDWNNVYYQSGGTLYFHDKRFTVVNDFKSYLAAQYAAGTPVTVWYVLANETTGIVNEPLCKIGDYADELHSEDAGVSIPTTKGQNTLTVDTELQPSSVSLTGGIK